MQLKLKPGFIRLNTLALAAALALACTLALLFCGCQSKAEREKLAEEGLLYYKNLDFNNAKRCFLTCGDSYKYTEYLESIAEYEKLYAQAVELVSASKPNEARAIFVGITGYLNSADFVEYIDSLKVHYDSGVKLYESGRYLEAYSSFADACGYESSAAYLRNIEDLLKVYNEAVELMNVGNYEDAVLLFQSLNTEFENSDDLIETCRSRLAVSPVLLNSFIKAYNSEYSSEGIRIEAGSTGKPGSQFALRDTRGILFTGLTDEFGRITYITCRFEPEVLESIEPGSVSTVAAHFIHALNTHTCSLDSVTADISSYLNAGENGRLYGCMNVSSLSESSGAFVISAGYEK